MSTVHVVPLHDLVEHVVPGGIPAETVAKAGADTWLCIEAAGEERPCVCGPTLEFVPNADGVDAWLWVHHSFDGRELTE